MHVAEVLSQYEFARSDERLQQMVAFIDAKADQEGLFTPESEWMAWKGWDFGQKQHPSAWLTFLVYRIKKRMQQGKVKGGVPMSGPKLPESWLNCRNPQQWHDWLVQNHDQKDQIWLKIKKAHAAGEGILLAEAVEEAICYGWIDGKMYSLDEESFIIRLTPRRPGSVWSLVNRRRAEALIEAGRMTEAGLAAIQAAKANGKWQAAYSSKEVPDLPAELKQAFREDPAAREHFEGWPTGEKAHYLFWIAQAKRADTRQKRIAETLERTKSNPKSQAHYEDGKRGGS